MGKLKFVITTLISLFIISLLAIDISLFSATSLIK